MAQFLKRIIPAVARTPMGIEFTIGMPMRMPEGFAFLTQ